MDNSHDSNEPVAWAVQTDDCLLPADAISWVETQRHTVPLYTRPQAREPLTDEEIHAIYDEVARREPYGMATTRRNIARAIEAAHGIGEKK